MMFADLVDLDDFIDRLREVGLELSSGSDAAQVERQLESWIDHASRSEQMALRQLLAELERQSQGLMLPEVAIMVSSARARLH